MKYEACGQVFVDAIDQVEEVPSGQMCLPKIYVEVLTPTENVAVSEDRLFKEGTKLKWGH